MDAAPRIYTFGEFELDEALFELRRRGEPIELQPKPLQLLFYLVRQRDRVAEKRELFDELWPDVIVSEAALTSALRDLRRALDDSGPRNRIISTLRGRGYRFTAPVTERPALAGPRREEGLEGPRIFVGRAAVLARLERALDAAARGGGGIVLLRGEPGIGKTRTVEQFASTSRMRGVSVYETWCYEGEGAPPYRPWAQLLRQLNQDRKEALRERLGAEADDLPALLVEQAGSRSAPSQEPEEARFQLFERVASFLSAAAAGGALLVVIDDLHAADPASLRLLDFLARELAQSRILILGTYRDVQVHRGHPLAQTVAELARHDLCTRIPLEGLSRDEIAELVPALTGAPASPDWIGALAQRTDGNPFFIKEMVQLLAARGARALQDVTALSHELPPGLREVFRGRLQLLSPRCNEALAVASVIGGTFELETLAQASDIAPAELAKELETARQSGLLSEAAGGAYRFSHSLIQETVYAEQSPARRSELHRRVGEALESIGHSGAPGLPGALAHHFGRAAQKGDAAKAVEYAARAAERAMELLAFEEAEAHYSSALELRTRADAIERCELLLGLGEARAGGGHRAGSRAAFEEAASIARELKDAERLARAAEGFAGRPIQFSVDAAAVGLLEEALGSLDPSDSPLRIRILVWLAGHVFAPRGVQRADELMDEAMERAARRGDPALLARALEVRDWLQWGRVLPEDRYRSASECLRLAEQAGDDALAGKAQLHRIRAKLELGDLDAAESEFAEFERRVEERRLLTESHQVAGYGAMAALLRGDFEHAERLSLEALNRAVKNAHEPGFAVATLRMGLIRREQGRLEEIETVARDLVDRQPENVGAHCGLALLEAELGRSESAEGRLQRLAAHDFEALWADPEWLVSAAFLSDACYRLEARDAAAALYERLRPWASFQIILGDGQAVLGSTHYYLGQLAATTGDLDSAEAHYAEAESVHEQMGAHPWLAHTRYAWALALEQRGERERALETARPALEAARDLGMTALAARAAELCGALEAS